MSEDGTNSEVPMSENIECKKDPFTWHLVLQCKFLDTSGTIFIAAQSAPAALDFM